MPRRAFTLIEMMVVVAIIAVLVGLLLPALRQARRSAASLEDRTQIRQIHQTMVVFAHDNDDVLPTPGLINREADPFTGRQTSGAGDEDFSKNTSANLYSALIAREYFKPDLLVSPVELNPLISIDDDYDYSAYRPADDVYWDGDVPTGDPPVDDRFQANIENGQSNTSYAHLALCGKRKKQLWRASAGSSAAIMGSRAPYRGAEASAGDEYERSYTLGMHGSVRSWAGNIAFGDNHVDLVGTYYPSQVVYQPSGGELSRDNMFDQEFGDPDPGSAGDVFLTMTRQAQQNMVLDYREALIP